MTGQQLGPGQWVRPPQARQAKPLHARLSKALAAARTALLDANEAGADLPPGCDEWLHSALASLLVEAHLLAERRGYIQGPNAARAAAEQAADLARITVPDEQS